MCAKPPVEGERFSARDFQHVWRMLRTSGAKLSAAASWRASRRIRPLPGAGASLSTNTRCWPRKWRPPLRGACRSCARRCSGSRCSSKRKQNRGPGGRAPPGCFADTPATSRQAGGLIAASDTRRHNLYNMPAGRVVWVRGWRRGTRRRSIRAVALPWLPRRNPARRGDPADRRRQDRRQALLREDDPGRGSPLTTISRR